MRSIALVGTVRSDHTLTVTLPDDVPIGTHNLVIEVLESATLTFDEIAARGVERRKAFGGRSKEEIDADLARIRNDAELEIKEIEELYKKVTAETR